MIASQSITSASLTDRMTAAFVAALLGCFVLFGVGFTTISAVHNAAHDSRHSFAFPCH